MSAAYENSATRRATRSPVSRRAFALQVLLLLGLLLITAPLAAAPPGVGDTAPDFALTGSDGRIHRLSDYRGSYVALAWFPKAFTGG